MTLEKWSKKEIIKLHKEYKGSYAGDVCAREIIRLSKKHVKGIVLDVGSGSLVNSLSNDIGIDLFPKHSNSIKGDVTNLPFRDCSFDTVFCTELLEHLCDKNLENGLKEIRRVLSERGYLIITVPYKEKLEAQMVLCPKCGARFHSGDIYKSLMRKEWI